MIDWLLVVAPVAFSALVFGLALGTQPVDISLQDITTPSALTDRGYAEGTLDDLLERRIIQIIDEAGSDRPVKRIEVGTPDTTINAYAEIVNVEAPVRATQRLLDLVHYVAEVHFLADSKGDTINATLRIRDSNTLQVVRFVTFQRPSDDIDHLIGQVARSIVGFLDPYILAAYLYRDSLKVPKSTADAEVVAYVKSVIDTSDPVFLPWFYGLLGQLSERVGDPAMAIAYYQEALQRDPDFSLGHASWGRTLADQGKIDEAIDQYVAALSIDPDLPVAYVYLAQALIEQGRYKDALAALALAGRLAPEFADVYTTRADVYTRLELPEQAQAQRSRALVAQKRQPHQNLYDTL
jgi:tetratricopeptide (TPR) repeat protein